MRWYRKLHWQILFGLIAGLAFGLVSCALGWQEFTSAWIRPWGTIFINLLKLIAVPLVLASLVSGVASLSDPKRLGRIGGKTLAIYIFTTVVAITIGLIAVNLLQPGKTLDAQVRAEIEESFESETTAREASAAQIKERGPLQPLVDMIPGNFFFAAADNRNMLQIVFVALLIGIGLIRMNHQQGAPIRNLFESFSELIIQLVGVIMLMAPVGVFALIAAVITDVGGDDPARALQILKSLGMYGVTVVCGLLVQTFGVYWLLLRFFTPLRFGPFYRALRPVQLLAFTSSSSGATLPLTIKTAEEKLGVSKEVAGFVLPLGATINMDGTALYQAVAAVFIAQVSGMEIGISGQLTIILTATLASIGSAAVPGAGIIMLIIVLEAIGVPAQGIALIIGVDRILDMCRTVTNVTGDTTVASIVAHSENELRPVEEDGGD